MIEQLLDRLRAEKERSSGLAEALKTARHVLLVGEKKFQSNKFYLCHKVRKDPK